MERSLFLAATLCIYALSISVYCPLVSAKEINNVGNWQNGKALTKIEDTRSGAISVLHTTLIKGNLNTWPMFQFTFSKLEQTDHGTYIGKDACKVANFPGEDKYRDEHWLINDQRTKMRARCVTSNGSKVLIVIPSTWKREHAFLEDLFKKSSKPISFQRLTGNEITTQASAIGFTKAWQAKRIEMTTKSANQGDAHAQLTLGALYSNGEGVTQSYQNAAKWFRKAAEQGEQHAQHNLGILYQNGQGVTQSHENAAKWFLKAAEQGNSRSMLSLGILYQTGEGVPKNDEYAARLYLEAAKRGDAYAQYLIGMLFMEGTGVPQSDQNALMWWHKALESHPNETALLNNLAWYYTESDQLSKAKPFAEKAYKLAGANSPTIADTYGYYLLKSGKPVQAMSVLGKAYKAMSDSPEISLHYAESLIANNYNKSAKEVLAKVNAENPELVTYKRELLAKIE